MAVAVTVGVSDGSTADRTRVVAVRRRRAASRGRSSTDTFLENLLANANEELIAISDGHFIVVGILELHQCCIRHVVADWEKILPHAVVDQTNIIIRYVLAKDAFIFLDNFSTHDAGRQQAGQRICGRNEPG
jgi:hypothetical protein